jgi:hypothetical protein
MVESGVHSKIHLCTGQASTVAYHIAGAGRDLIAILLTTFLVTMRSLHNST